MHALCPQQAGLNRCIYRSHATSDDHHAASDWQRGKVVALAQAGDEVHRVFHAGQVFARYAQRLGGGQAHTEEHGRVLLAQRMDLGVGLQLPVVADFDAANIQQPRQFALGEVVGRLVRGQTVFVQATGFGLCVKHHDIVAQARQRVGACQTRRACANDRHFFPRGRGAGKELGLVTFHHRVHRVALQPPDGDRSVLLRVAYTHGFAQILGRANPGAHAAQRVAIQNGARCTTQVPVANALDERGHVDAGGTGGGAGCVKAIQAALGFQQRLAVG